MVNVRILKDVGLGVAGAVTLVGGVPVLTGCAEVAAPAEPTAVTRNVTEREAVATGTIDYRYYEYAYTSTNGGDEFIRAGDVLTVTLPFATALDPIVSADPTAKDRIGSDRTKVAAKLRVSYKDGAGAEVGRAELPVTWPVAPGDGIGATAPFTVPAGTPRMDLQLVVQEVGHGAEIPFDYAYHSTFAIFGAYLPSKEVLFDNGPTGEARTRVIEGGDLVAGANATVAYTDWRADKVVDRLALDLTIGTGQVSSRFGVSVVPINGDLVYEISVAYSTDGGVHWANGGVLAAEADPAVLANPDEYGRKAYTKTFGLPANAKGLDLAFHVKAILVADPHNIYITRWKPGVRLGERIVLRDIWDNNGGKNYKIAVQ